MYQSERSPLDVRLPSALLFLFESREGAVCGAQSVPQKSILERGLTFAMAARSPHDMVVSYSVVPGPEPRNCVACQNSSCFTPRPIVRHVR